MISEGNTEEEVDEEVRNFGQSFHANHIISCLATACFCFLS